MWQQWVNAVLGLWTIVVPFLGLTGSALSWTLVVTGLLVAVFALWGVQTHSRMEESGQRHRTS
ncbi:hypothetical protein HYV30_04130 [Candidatus Kaiserbacteria bacterium]|nr:hypothetical protein [Candidatus Kaiserbacteria bacterium]